MSGDARAAVAAYVQTRLLKGRALDSGSLWEDGTLDSLAVVRLVRFLEETFSITVPHADVTPKTFASIDSIAAYVERRRGK